jgi:DNA-binding NtrC family response regulator
LNAELWGRLSVLPIPPLRVRFEDFPDLALECLRDLAVESPAPLPAKTLSYLRSRPWQRNVEEFREALTVAQGTAGGAPLQPEHFPPSDPTQAVETRLRAAVAEWVREKVAAAGGVPSQLHQDLLCVVEGALLGEVLRQCDGRLLPATRRMGLARMTVRRMVRRHLSHHRGTKSS